MWLRCVFLHRQLGPVPEDIKAWCRNMETENQVYPVFVPPGNQNVARVWT